VGVLLFLFCLPLANANSRLLPVIEIPAYKLLPSAMLSAVAWNYASAYFEMRIFTTDDKNDLYEYRMSYSCCAFLFHALGATSFIERLSTHPG
jgi:hypothetical protein